MRILLCLYIFFGITISSVWAQNGGLRDLNGDGLVSALAFGDSITRGVGDTLSPGIESPPDIINYIGPGYPGRLQSLLNIPVDNEGVSGEEFTTQGIFRIPASVGRSTADYVLLFEGNNDAARSLSDPELERKLQRAINVIRLFGKEPILGTYYATSGDRSSRSPILANYSSTIRQLAVTNDFKIMDFELAFKTTCGNKIDCELLNQPDGLHPNTRGYRVLAEVAAATLLTIDIFSATGNSELASALGVPVAEILTKANVSAVVPQ